MTLQSDTTKQCLYEGMYIIHSTLSEEAKGKALERITNEITSRGGVLHKVHDLGSKKLAYEVRGRKEGHYYLVYFSIEPRLIKEMWSEYHLNEDLLRFMTLRATHVMEEITFKPMSTD